MNWYRKDGHAVIEIMGEVDVYTAPRLRELFIYLVDHGEYKLILDLEMLEFLDSTGLNVLTGGLKRARAHDGFLHIVCSQERILRIFRVTKLFKVFSIFDTVDEALSEH